MTPPLRSDGLAEYAAILAEIAANARRGQIGSW